MSVLYQGCSNIAVERWPGHCAVDRRSLITADRVARITTIASKCQEPNPKLSNHRESVTGICRSTTCRPPVPVAHIAFASRAHALILSCNLPATFHLHSINPACQYGSFDSTDLACFFRSCVFTSVVASRQNYLGIPCLGEHYVRFIAFAL